MSNNTNKQIEFVGRVERQLYSSEDYKMYSVFVERDKYPDIKFTIYGTATIGGNLHSLTPGVEYLIKATEKNGNKGYLYNVINIRKTDLKTEGDVYDFLQEILTFRQASELYKHYPQIVELVMNGEADQKVDLSKLNGIKEYTFEKIKDKIVENFVLYDLIGEYGGILTMGMMKKLYEKYPSIQKIKSELKNKPYKCLVNLSRVGFKTADTMLLKLEKEGKLEFSSDLKTSKDRCMACMTWILEDSEQNGNTKMSIPELRKIVMKITPACAHHFVDCINGNKDIYYSKETMDIALMSTYRTEEFIAKDLVRRLNSEINIWNYDIEKYRCVDGINLSDEQMGLLDSVCKNKITVLTAPGGCGKSFSTQALINMLKDNSLSFILASPTGKAAKKLADYTKEKAQTIHRTLGFANGEFTYNEEHPLVADVLLLDEVGMTDIWLFVQLLKAIPDSTRIVLVGDAFQLNSVGCGALLRDLIATDFIPQVNFTKVFRMGEGGVLTACTYTRQNKKFITENKLTQIGTDKSYTFIPATSQDINKKILQLYIKLLEKYDSKDITVISSYNVGENGCLALNQLLQPIANPNSKSGKYITVKQDKEDVRFYIGDSVIMTVNNYRSRIYMGGMITEEECLICNGDQGVVKEIDNNGVVIDFDGVDIYYSKGELQPLKHSFAISCHRMQGSQNKIIIFCAPSSHMFFLNNNIVYTAISRAEKMVYHFSDERTLNAAIKKSDNKKRQTMLERLLWEEIKKIE
jgi:exodeoxyribonuclease V alpha subunit